MKKRRAKQIIDIQMCIEDCKEFNVDFNAEALMTAIEDMLKDKCNISGTSIKYFKISSRYKEERCNNDMRDFLK
jgi:hypothetical protein